MQRYHELWSALERLREDCAAASASLDDLIALWDAIRWAACSHWVRGVRGAAESFNGRPCLVHEFAAFDQCHRLEPLRKRARVCSYMHTLPGSELPRTATTKQNNNKNKHKGAG